MEGAAGLMAGWQGAGVMKGAGGGFQLLVDAAAASVPARCCVTTSAFRKATTRGAKTAFCHMLYRTNAAAAAAAAAAAVETGSGIGTSRRAAIAVGGAGAGAGRVVAEQSCLMDILTIVGLGL